MLVLSVDSGTNITVKIDNIAGRRQVITLTCHTCSVYGKYRLASAVQLAVGTPHSGELKTYFKLWSLHDQRNDGVTLKTLLVA